jgi:hypothetical protein
MHAARPAFTERSRADLPFWPSRDLSTRCRHRIEINPLERIVYHVAIAQERKGHVHSVIINSPDVRAVDPVSQPSTS